MNPQFTKASFKQLSTKGLHLLAKDAESRIGSHVAGGNPVKEYVKNQRKLLEYIQAEIIRRNNSD